MVEQLLHILLKIAGARDNAVAAGKEQASRKRV